jgi:hypothetical protein
VVAVDNPWELSPVVDRCCWVISFSVGLGYVDVSAIPRSMRERLDAAVWFCESACLEPFFA